MPRTAQRVRCPECDKTFKNEWGLKVHGNKIHHRDLAPHASFPSKKKVTKVKRVEHQPTTITVKGVQIQFCPQCGLNLRAVFLALDAVKGLQ